jgi:hypothetical protein
MNNSYQETPSIHGGVRVLLRLESLAVLAISLFGFAALHANWWLFAALFLLPDLTFAAYWAGPRIGAIAYNALHSYVGPILLGLAALAIHWSSVLPITLIWTAHIGFDRALGYGLKYPSAFSDTHLGQLRRKSSPELNAHTA